MKAVAVRKMNDNGERVKKSRSKKTFFVKIFRGVEMYEMIPN